MPCYYPLAGYRSKDINPSGKRSIVFNVNQGYRDLPVELPCGRCIGCRLERSRQWAVRCVHESKLYEDNCFITLTYSDEFLPKDNSLDVSDFQKFMKRLRFKYGSGVRYFHCGEYGENFGRPHYHACLFNFDFKDRVHWKTVNGEKYYVSQELEELWQKGHCVVGDVTFESAAYVARYITKKVSGKDALEHYNTIDLTTGEVLAERRPEYVTMSRRPGIGKMWFEKYHKDVYAHDFLVMRGKKMRPPKFYNSQFELLYPSDYKKIKADRVSKAAAHKDDNTYDRLVVKEQVVLERFNRLIRSLK